MSPARISSSCVRFVVFFVLVLAATDRASAQPHINEDALLLPAGTDQWAGMSVAVDGNAALVSWLDGEIGTSGAKVSVFRRHPDSGTWTEEAVLASGGERFGISGDTAVVLLDHFDDRSEAHVFQRDRGGVSAWGYAATVRCVADPGVVLAHSSVAISGNTIVLGVAIPFDPSPQPFGLPLPGFACLFDRNHGGADAWGLAATVHGDTAQPGMIDVFATDVGISGDTLVATSCSPRLFGSGSAIHCPGEEAYVFERHRGGAGAWGRQAKLILSASSQGEVDPPLVAIDGDTIIMGTTREELPSRFYSHPTYVFERNRDGPGAWGQVKVLVPAPALTIDTFNIAISGNTIALSTHLSLAEPGNVHVYSRHQQLPGGWGLTDVLAPSHATVAYGRGLAVSGATILSGDQLANQVGDQLPLGGAFVLGIDTDRDGVGDDLDRCPRDPLNNEAGRCQRATARALVMDDRMSGAVVGAVARNGEFVITAQFSNLSDLPIGNPFLVVSELSGGNVLKNADEGPGGVGATLSPDTGNGILEPGEIIEATFVIGLAAKKPFRFLVHVMGDAN